MEKGNYGIVSSRKLISMLSYSLQRTEKELIEDSLMVGVAPALCVNTGCGYFEELSLSADKGFCPVCVDTSVRSVIFLSSMEEMNLDLYRMSVTDLESLKYRIEAQYEQTQSDEDYKYLDQILQALEYRYL